MICIALARGTVNVEGVFLAVVAGRSGTIVAGRYRLEQRVGAGGMGEVYRATHLELGVPVAVKLLSPAIAGLERAVKRFRREARAAARLKSAHIVHIYDFGVDGDVPFLVMELLEGENLAQRLQRVGKVTIAEAAAWVDQASKGLAAAHAHGIVHRDVKPSNFFLAQTPDGEVLKVLDFGIAKPEDEDVTVTASQEVVGSPLYMSPEQATAAELDLRTDVWSLGAIVFRMITGQEAFRAQNTSAVLLKITSGKAPRASSVAPELPAAVDAFFERAFAAEIGARFQSSAELSSALASLAQPGVETGAEFYRTKETVGLTPAGVALPRRRTPRWLWLTPLVLIPALWLAWLRSRPPESEPSPLQDAAASASMVPQPSPAPSSPPTAPSARSVTSAASSSPSLGPRPAAARSPAKPPPKPAPSTSTPARPTDRKARDPLFGL